MATKPDYDKLFAPSGEYDTSVEDEDVKVWKEFARRFPKEFVAGVLDNAVGLDKFGRAILPKKVNESLDKVDVKLFGDTSSNILNDYRLKQMSEIGPSGVSPGRIAGNVAGAMLGAKGLGVAGKTVGILPKKISTVVPQTYLGKVVSGGAAGATGAALLSPHEGKEEDYWQDQLEKAKTGLIFGAAVPGVVLPVARATGAVVKKAANTIGDAFGRGTERRAGLMLNRLAGDAKPQIINAIRNEGDPLNMVTQSVFHSVDNPPPEFMTLDEFSEKFAPSTYNLTKDAQKAAVKSQLLSASGGRNAAESYVAAKRAEDMREAIAKVNRDATIDAVNSTNEKYRSLLGDIDQYHDTAKRAAENVEDVRRLMNAKQIAEDKANRLYPKEPSSNLAGGRLIGNPRISGRYSYANDLAKLADTAASEMAQKSLDNGRHARLLNESIHARIDNLAAQDVVPISKESIIAQLDSMMNEPGRRAVQPNVNALKQIKRAFEKAEADGNGFIHPEDIMAIRTHGVNVVIDKAGRGMDATAPTRKYVQSTLIDVKPIIDDAIARAGGKQWQQYLDEYKSISRDIEKMRFASEMSTLFETNPEKYRNVVLGNDVDTVTRIFGEDNPVWQSNVGDDLNAYLKGFDFINSDKQIGLLGRQGEMKFSDSVKKSGKEALQLKGMLSRPISIWNKVADVINDKADEATMDYVAKLIADPARRDEVLELLTKKDRIKLIDKLEKKVGRTGLLGGGAAAGNIEEYRK